ncbi:MAG: rhodanese-like domain-containing protein [Cyanobacteria bacterium P01_D01_bin.105]
MNRLINKGYSLAYARRGIAKRLSIGLLLCSQLMACSVATANNQISVDALAVQIDQGTAPLILDVRSPEEYARGHIPSAINIDYRDIPNQLDAIRSFNSNTIIVYCERGIRAGRADHILSNAGFESVVQLTGDMVAWRKADLPMSTSQ